MTFIELLKVLDKRDQIRVVPSDSDKWDPRENYIMNCPVENLPWWLVDTVRDKAVKSVGIYQTTTDGTFLKVEYDL